MQADASDEAGFTAAINGAAQRHGHRFDVLVNNAMAFSWGAIEETSLSDVVWMI